MFETIDDQPDFPALEEAVLQRWRQDGVYEQSLELRKDGPRFVFYEGPPTANGKPHPGHCLTRAIKDLFPRYRSMRGFLCQRKAGWDTHGLPVEVEVCKELGIHSKEEIEAYGVEPFVQLCQRSVWRYIQDWERLTERLGFWLHLKDAYVTYHQSFVESVWWSLKKLFERGLLYEGHKIVWWWAQGGTALSSGEVGQGYREVGDPSVYVRFPLIDEPNVSLLIWTTTPWTLPTNQFAAVHPQLSYARCRDEETGEQLILAEALVEPVAAKAKRSWAIESVCKGQELLGLRYQPPYDFYYRERGEQQGRLRDGGQQHVAWRVVEADFVTTDSGTGVVHQAPAFGEVDFDVFKAQVERFEEGQGPAMQCAVGPDGKFTSDAPPFEGQWVKDADKEIIRDLKSRSLLLHQEQYLHEYPFCWRADQDPLIQYPRRSWFIRTSQFKDKMLANNRQIRWLPEHIRDGRFGKFLESNVDWALSRERYWGTPLPIWKCETTGKMEAVGSYEELQGKPGVRGFDAWKQAKADNPDLPDDLCVHKPYIDDVVYDSPFAENAAMRRVPEVIDCWYDAGAMPFAQWGFPHRDGGQLDSQFPADFISEAVDQTRGWFYSLLAISTLLGESSNASDGDLSEASGGMPRRAYPHPFQNCIVLGLMLAETYACDTPACGHRHLNAVDQCEKCGGKVSRKVEKMSKRLRNYREPSEIFDKHGADALRWYFLANQPPWSSIIYSERAIKEASSGLRLTIWNVFKFFGIFANIDKFEPETLLDGDAGDLGFDSLENARNRLPAAQRGELDRWVLSELHRTAERVVAAMDAYDNFSAAGAIAEFVESLSNWWLRRSRPRFWTNELAPEEKANAYWTLYECLLTIAKWIAPFTPFLADMLWRVLAGPFGERVRGSVHLCDYPEPDPDVIDPSLSQRMELLRQIASLGRSARTEAKLKIRQPLARIEVVLAKTEHQVWLEEHDALLREELNVKRIEYVTDADPYIAYLIQPNFKRLGPKIGKLVPGLKKQLASADGAALLRDLRETGKTIVSVEGQAIELDAEDIQVRLQARDGWAAAQGPSCVVVLNTELTPELVQEGVAKDVNRCVQERRKDMQCAHTDRIDVAVVAESEEIRAALQAHQSWLEEETLAVSWIYEPLEGVEPRTFELAQGAIDVQVRVANRP